jgi:hypothetical protein
VLTACWLMGVLMGAYGMMVLFDPPEPPAAA